MALGCFTFPEMEPKISPLAGSRLGAARRSGPATEIVAKARRVETMRAGGKSEQFCSDVWAVSATLMDRPKKSNGMFLSTILALVRLRASMRRKFYEHQ